MTAESYLTLLITTSNHQLNCSKMSFMQCALKVQRDRACSNEEQRQECELRDLQGAQKLESNRYRNTTCIVRKDDWSSGEKRLLQDSRAFS